jgi:hypothetical protein
MRNLRRELHAGESQGGLMLAPMLPQGPRKPLEIEVSDQIVNNGGPAVKLSSTLKGSTDPSSQRRPICFARVGVGQVYCEPDCGRIFEGIFPSPPPYSSGAARPTENRSNARQTNAHEPQSVFWVKCELLHTGTPPSSGILAFCRIATYGDSG